MSVNYIDKSTGDLIRVAGQGKAEYGASTMRSGTIVSETNLEAGAYVQLPIVFSSPMPDDDYIIIITDNNMGYYTFAPISTSKTKNGFSLFVCNDRDMAQGYNFTYNAFKLYTDTEYNSLLDLPDRVEAVEEAAADFAPVDVVENGNMKPVTSNAVASMNIESHTLLATSLPANGVPVAVAQITVPKGKWLILGQLHTQPYTDGENLLSLAISSSTLTAITANVAVDQRRQVSGIWGFVHGMLIVNPTAGPETIKLYGASNIAVETIKAEIVAIKIAE